MRTAVVILNWNTRALLEAFLPALAASLPADAGLVVADNASFDGSTDAVRSILPDVRIVSFQENFGFTGGYNRAMDLVLAEESPEYLVLMNSDIDVPEGWLEPLVAWMDANPCCGACGPKLLALDRTGDGFVRSSRFEYAGAAGGWIDRFGYPFCRGRVLSRTEPDEGQYDAPKEVLWASGACLLVRASVWKELGGLDPRFFAHMEEIDLCWRMWRSGWTVSVVPESRVWHLGGATLPQGSPWKTELNFRNNRLLLEKNLEPTLRLSGRRLPRLRARARIAFRSALDLGSAAVWFLSGKRDFSRAVMKARKDAHRLLAEGSASPVAPAAAVSCAGVPGYRNGICILPLAALLRNRIFRYLKRYEDNN